MPPSIPESRTEKCMVKLLLTNNKPLFDVSNGFLIKKNLFCTLEVSFLKMYGKTVTLIPYKFEMYMMCIGFKIAILVVSFFIKTHILNLISLLSFNY